MTVTDPSSLNLVDLPHVVFELLGLDEISGILDLTLRTRCNRRPFSRSLAEVYAGDMIAGRWNHFHPDPLQICPCGAVQEGRHRMWAAKLAGIPLNAYVARGVPHHVHAVTDVGKRRLPSVIAAGALAELAERQGVASLCPAGAERAVASAARLCGLHAHYRNTHHWTDWRKISVSGAQLDHWVKNEYPALAGHYPGAVKIREGCPTLTPTAALAFLTLLHADAPHLRTEADIFARHLAHGGSTETGFLPYLARVQVQKVRGRDRGAHELGLLLKTWALWLQAKTPRVLAFTVSENMPPVHTHRHRDFTPHPEA